MGKQGWQKGQSGNPAGRPKKSQEVRALAKTESPKLFKKTILMAYGKPVYKGGPVPTVAETLRAQEMVYDRALGKPATVDSGGMFQGARIIVNTGIVRDRPAESLEPPTVEGTVATPDTEAPTNGKATDPDSTDS